MFVYQVQFPNDQAAPVPERYVKVRCLAPIGDPVDALTAVGFDTQFIHDRRIGVLSTQSRVAQAREASLD